MILFFLASVGCLTLSIYFLSQYRHAKTLEKVNRHIQQALQTADALTDNEAAVAAYQNIKPMLPEVQLRILQRQWGIALEKLQQINLARVNSVLQDDSPQYIQQLKNYLDEMWDRCNSTLADSASLPPEIVWRIHNIEGSVKLLTAFLMLYNEQNPDKVQGVIREALSDFKTAIEVVDKADVPAYEKNIPRWNFEMLTGEDYIKKMEVAKTDPEKNQALQESLEALIPEMGGYAPGEPIETKIKK
jgi:hypothetical protein